MTFVRKRDGKMLGTAGARGNLELSYKAKAGRAAFRHISNQMLILGCQLQVASWLFQSRSIKTRNVNLLDYLDLSQNAGRLEWWARQTSQIPCRLHFILGQGQSGFNFIGPSTKILQSTN